MRLTLVAGPRRLAADGWDGLGRGQRGADGVVQWAAGAIAGTMHGLGLAPGSHTQGLLGHDTRVLGQPSATLHGDERWQTEALQPRDVLAMHALMLHQALANAGPWLRVSEDVRWAK